MQNQAVNALVVLDKRVLKGPRERKMDAVRAERAERA